jgi:hypothetical protein
VRTLAHYEFLIFLLHTTMFKGAEASYLLRYFRRRFKAEYWRLGGYYIACVGFNVVAYSN